MAQQTQLTALALSGQVQAFSAKTAAPTGGPHTPGEITALIATATPGQTQSFTAKAEAEIIEIARVATEKGRGKEEFFPLRPMVSPLEERKGWLAHVRAAEAQMWEQSEKVRLVRQSAHIDEGIPRPPSERTIKKRPQKFVRRTDERLEAAANKAAEVREENAFKAHLKATEGIVRSENIKEEKRQRDAEKDIGFTPTQIKRDRADRAKGYEQRATALVNLERAKRAKAELQDVEDLRNKQRLAALKKARAAKKRKAKRKK